MKLSLSREIYTQSRGQSRGQSRDSLLYISFDLELFSCKLFSQDSDNSEFIVSFLSDRRKI